MPKKKTHKAASKRCKITATGKVLSARAGKRHLASCKTRKRKRNLRGTATLAAPEQKRIKKLLAS
ncbi:MAG: 50S ribosomal protein L35 [Kiritimatiellae bacterium]|jgi:large subunit ribosomal protein L35|nr:50S ribosomal protein L35 [Kiritimatiellia bacterium]MBO7299723.1 50S ribosomal protein L35 [Kiritimatiellia bacterium]MBQ2282312.1 50S ribosomal protein L35 [Kiritimatiellia bacterium]